MESFVKTNAENSWYIVRKKERKKEGN